MSQEQYFTKIKFRLYLIQKRGSVIFFILTKFIHTKFILTFFTLTFFILTFFILTFFILTYFILIFLINHILYTVYSLYWHFLNWTLNKFEIINLAKSHHPTVQLHKKVKSIYLVRSLSELNISITEVLQHQLVRGESAALLYLLKKKLLPDQINFQNISVALCQCSLNSSFCTKYAVNIKCAKIVYSAGLDGGRKILMTSISGGLRKLQCTSLSIRAISLSLSSRGVFYWEP